MFSVSGYALPGSSELPTNVAHWRVDASRAALLIHDMQLYFLEPFPSGFREELIRNCRALRTRCAELGMPVFYTAQPGSMTDAQRGLLKDIWGPGMRADPTHREIIDALAPGPADTVLTKWRYSAFHRSDLLDRLRSQGRDQLIICGVYGHVGILATALEAFSNDIQPFLVANAIGDFSAEHHRMVIDYAAARCSVVLSTEDIVQ